MEKKPDGGGPFVILAAAGMVLCCALPLLLLSGGLGAVTAWLFDGSGILLLFAGALALAAGGLFLRHRRGAGKPDEFRTPAAARGAGTASGDGPQTKS
jgi:hypothetical protein